MHKLQQSWLMGFVALHDVGPSQTWDSTSVPCVARQTPNHGTNREAFSWLLFKQKRQLGAKSASGESSVGATVGIQVEGDGDGKVGGQGRQGVTVREWTDQQASSKPGCGRRGNDGDQGLFQGFRSEDASNGGAGGAMQVRQEGEGIYKQWHLCPL